jgi:uncharacterized protein (TIGR03067 family)
MKRLLALLVAMGLVVAADRSYTFARDDEKKEEKKKDEDKKEDKKKDDKKKEDKKEVKLTEEQKKELKAISGKFTVTKFEQEGDVAGPDKLKKMSVVQDNEKWTYESDEGKVEGTDVVYPDKKPKEIDSTYTGNTPDAGKTVKGIYKIDDDTITYCWSAAGKDRPTEFSGKGKGMTLMVIKRVKAEKKEKEKDKDEEKKEKDN